MRDLRPFLALLRGRPLRTLALGTLVAALAFAAGVSLLALAGWFIAACALAGASGVMTFSYLLASGGVRSLAIVRTLTRYGDKLLNHRATLAYLTRLRVEVFRRAAALDPLRYSRYRSGDVLERLLGDVGTLDTLLVRVLVPSVAIGGVTLVGLGFLGWLSPSLLPLVGGLTLTLGVALPTATSLSTRRAGARLRSAKAGLRTHLVESAQGVREIRSYGAEAATQARLGEEVRGVRRSARTLHLAEALAGGLSEILVWGGVLLAVMLSVNLFQANTLSAAQIALAAFLTLVLLEGVAELPAAYAHLGLARGAARRLNAFLGGTSQTSASPELPECVPKDSIGTPGQLELRNVTFAYPGREPVFTDLSYTFSPGVNLIVGPSGRGKTTLLRLLVGELEPEQGTVDVDVRASSVTLIGQDAHIFSGTVRDNLLVAAPDASEQRLWRALRVVCLDDAVRALPEGLDARVGGSGADLSGGQRRRLSLARAVLLSPSVLLLDEPSAGLDAETARRVLNNLRRALPDVTFVIATHAPHLVRADRVLELRSQGEVSYIR